MRNNYFKTHTYHTTRTHWELNLTESGKCELLSRSLQDKRANLTRVTSPPNSTTGGSRLIFCVPFSYISFPSFTFSGAPPNLTPRRFPFYLILIILLCFLFVFHLPGAPYRIFFLFLPWLPCHFYLVASEQQHVNL